MAGELRSALIPLLLQDGSGSIETAELKHVIEKCGIEVTEAQVAEMIKEADSDGSGTLEFNEFLDLMWKLQQGPSERELRNEMFSVSLRCQRSGCSASFTQLHYLAPTYICRAFPFPFRRSCLTTTWTASWRLGS